MSKLRSVSTVMFLTAVLSAVVFADTVGVQVQATADHPSLHVGERVTITVRVSRPDGDGSVPSPTASLRFGSEWNSGGQTVLSERVEGGRRVKVWEFGLVAVQPGATEVRPVAYFAVRDDLGGSGSVESFLGGPLTLQILPVRTGRLWPWITAGAFIVGLGVYYAAQRWVRRRGLRRTVAVDPLADALQMLDQLRALRREDKAESFLTNLEKVAVGYLSARLGQSLPTATATEMAAVAGAHATDAEAIAMLLDLLGRCGMAKYAGRSLPFDDLVAAEDLARRTLERLDRSWVQ